MLLRKFKTNAYLILSNGFKMMVKTDNINKALDLLLSIWLAANFTMRMVVTDTICHLFQCK